MQIQELETGTKSVTVTFLLCFRYITVTRNKLWIASTEENGFKCNFPVYSTLTLASFRPA